MLCELRNFLPVARFESTCFQSDVLLLNKGD